MAQFQVYGLPRLTSPGIMYSYPLRRDLFLFVSDGLTYIYWPYSIKGSIQNKILRSVIDPWGGKSGKLWRSLSWIEVSMHSFSCQRWLTILGQFPRLAPLRPANRPDVIDRLGAFVGESESVGVPLEFESFHVGAVLGEQFDQLVDNDSWRQLAKPTVGRSDH